MGEDGGEEDSLSGWRCSCGGFRANAALSPTCGIGGAVGGAWNFTFLDWDTRELEACHWSFMGKLPIGVII